MSPFRPSFPPQSRAFSQRFDFAGRLFSYSYELLSSQPLCFDIHPHCPGVYSSVPNTQTFRPSEPPTLLLTGTCRLFRLSLRSFPHSLPLFSMVCSLFCENTRGGGGSPGATDQANRTNAGRTAPPAPCGRRLKPARSARHGSRKRCEAPEQPQYIRCGAVRSAAQRRSPEAAQ